MATNKQMAQTEYLLVVNTGSLFENVAKTDKVHSRRLRRVEYGICEGAMKTERCTLAFAEEGGKSRRIFHSSLLSHRCHFDMSHSLKKHSIWFLLLFLSLLLWLQRPPLICPNIMSNYVNKNKDNYVIKLHPEMSKVST